MCRWAPDARPAIPRATPGLGLNCGCSCYAKDRVLGPGEDPMCPRHVVNLVFVVKRGRLLRLLRLCRPWVKCR